MVFHTVLFHDVMFTSWLRLSAVSRRQQQTSTGIYTDTTINHCILFSAQNVTITNKNIKLNNKTGKEENRIYNRNYITTSLSGSTWNHCLFHCLPSSQIFNSNFHGADALYIQTLSPKRSFSVSRIHGRHPSDFLKF